MYLSNGNKKFGNLEFFQVMTVSKTLYNNILPPGSELSLCHSFMGRSHPLISSPWGAYMTRAVISWFPSWHNESIWNAHITPITIIHQVLIVQTHGGMEG